MRNVILSVLYVLLMIVPVATIYLGIATVYEWYPSVLNNVVTYPTYPWGSISVLLSLIIVPICWPIATFKLALVPKLDLFDRLAVYWGVILSPISTIVFFASFYKNSGLNIPSTLTDPFSYIYFSAMTFTTVGYGDITPKASSLIFTTIEALVGYFQLGLLIAALTATVNRRK